MTEQVSKAEAYTGGQPSGRQAVSLRCFCSPASSHTLPALRLAFVGLHMIELVHAHLDSSLRVLGR